jgi:hypothetical protein
VSVYQVIHFSLVGFTMECSRFLPSSFSVSELFLLAAVNAYNTGFFFDSVLYGYKRRFIPGDNIANILVFSPWAFLNFAALIYCILASIEQRFLFKFKVNFKLFSCFGMGVFLTYWFATPYNDLATVGWFL